MRRRGRRLAGCAFRQRRRPHRIEDGAKSSGERGATGPTDQKHDLTRNIQAGLITLGYDPGPADGRLDTKTRDAIRRFQFDNTLPLNGEPSVYLWDDIKDRI